MITKQNKWNNKVYNYKEIPNLSYKSDFEYAFSINRRILYLTASWPFTSRNLLVHRILSRLTNIIYCIVIILLLLTTSLDLIFQNENIVVKIKEISTLNVCSGYFVKYIVTLLQGRNTRIIIKQMNEDWQNVSHIDRKVMLKYAKIGRFFTIIFASFLFAACASWELTALIKKATVVNNVTIHNLPYPMYWVFFDVRISPYYYGALLFQTFSTFVVSSIMCNTCISINFVMHLCGQFEVLSNALRDCINDKQSFEKLDLLLPRIIRRHYHLIRFSALIESTFRWIFYIEWFICIIGVCISGYLFIKEQHGIVDAVRNFTTLVTMSFLFLVICYIGERIIEQSTSIAETAYMSNWDLLQKRHIKMMNMIIFTHNHPRQLTAGKIIPLSMSEFTNVMKKAVAFFSLLRTIS